MNILDDKVLHELWKTTECTVSPDIESLRIFTQAVLSKLEGTGELLSPDEIKVIDDETEKQMIELVNNTEGNFSQDDMKAISEAGETAKLQAQHLKDAARHQADKAQAVKEAEEKIKRFFAKALEKRRKVLVDILPVEYLSKIVEAFEKINEELNALNQEGKE